MATNIERDMRGRTRQQEPLFVAVNVDKIVDRHLAPDHPLRRIKIFTDRVLATMSSDFDRLYSDRGRYSVPPECLLRSLLWQAMFSIRSERQLEETIRFDLRCRWFVGLPLDQDAWDHSTFSKAREAFRLEEIAVIFFERHVQFLRDEGLVSSDHLSVDGTLLAAWASHKSLISRDEFDDDGEPPPAPQGGRNAWVDFKGTTRSNETHASATDPEAKLMSKGGPAKLSFELSVLSENRNQLAVDFTVVSPSGTSERECAIAMVNLLCDRGRAPKTVGGDRKYADGDDAVMALARRGVAAHFSVRSDRPNALARLFHEDAGFPTSIRCRMRIEEIFAYLKTVVRIGQVKLRGLWRVFGTSAIALSAYNIRRHASLVATAR